MAPDFRIVQRTVMNRRETGVSSVAPDNSSLPWSRRQVSAVDTFCHPTEHLCAGEPGPPEALQAVPFPDTGETTRSFDSVVRRLDRSSKMVTAAHRR